MSVLELLGMFAVIILIAELVVIRLDRRDDAFEVRLRREIERDKFV